MVVFSLGCVFPPGPRQLAGELERLISQVKASLVSCWKYGPVHCPTDLGARKDAGRDNVGWPSSSGLLVAVAL